MNSKSLGQLSLEYILLMSVLLGIFAVFLSSAHSVYLSGLFAIDAKNAKIFSENLEKKINFLSFLADGSSLEITAKPLNNWQIYYENKKINIKIKSINSDQEKNFSFATKIPIQITNQNIEQNEKIIIEKKDSLILIKNS